MFVKTMANRVGGAPAASSLSVQPFLRWAGSKRKLLPVISSLIPQTFERYVEPFVGSACLFFFLNPSKAVLGDINAELINVYQQLTLNPQLLIGCFEGFQDRTPETFYRVRAEQPHSLNPLERAVRFIYLNRLCFNGLYRTNKKGEFNVPYGGGRSGDFPTAQELSAAAAVLRKADLMSAPFEEVLAQVRTGDFVYLDPPYSISNRRVFNNYSNDVFGIENLKRLRSELLSLDKNNIPFLLSYGLSREGLDLAKGFNTRHAVVQRQISGFAKHRRGAREMLVTNY